jgi:hypothetical protein
MFNMFLDLIVCVFELYMIAVTVYSFIYAIFCILCDLCLTYTKYDPRYTQRIPYYLAILARSILLMLLILGVFDIYTLKVLLVCYLF